MPEHFSGGSFDSGKPESTEILPARHMQMGSERKRKTRRFWFFWAVVGFIGDLLITLGVLIGLFLVWELWWTNFENSASIKNEVSQIQKDFGKVQYKIGAPRTDAPPVPKRVGEGREFGVIHIPALGYDHSTPIKEGTTKRVLDSGAFGHYTDTALPGEMGNFAMAVHREVYGARMYHVDQLEVGTPIVIETKDAWLVYKMIGHEIVKPTEIYVIQPDPFLAKKAYLAGKQPPRVVPTRRLLTVTTCHPLYISSHRWALQAEFSHWVKRSDGMPIEMINPDKLANGYSNVGRLPFGTENHLSALSAPAAAKEEK